MSSITSAVLFFAAIILSVVVHEAFHLVGARLAGMRVSRFFVGFGPTLWSRRVGETEVGFKAFPLGGFVNIAGMGDGENIQEGAVVEAAEDGYVSVYRLTEVLVDRGMRLAEARDVADAAIPEGACPSVQAQERLVSEVTRRYGNSAGVGSLLHRVLRGDEGRLYNQRPARMKALAIAAGPASHILIAFLLLLTLQLAWEQPTGISTTVVSDTLEESPASEAGILPGDRILAAGGVSSSLFPELREVIRSSPGLPLRIALEREGRTLEVETVPQKATDAEGNMIGAIGILMVPETLRVSPAAAAAAAMSGEPSGAYPGGVVPLAALSAKGLARILSPSGLRDLASQAYGGEERDAEGVMSLVGATSIAGQIGSLDQGLVILIGLVAAVNVFLALFNLVPVPPFDGGHLAAASIEAAVGKVRRLRGDPREFHLPGRAMSMAAIPVYMILAFLLLSSLWLDITAPIRLL